MQGRLLPCFLFAFLIVLTPELSANGVQENRIAKAKELIAQKNYNDAILILTKVVKEEPDRLDEAQELLDEIRAAKNAYNDQTSEFLMALYSEKDEAKALVIIAKIEALDKNPNPKTKKLIKDAKRSAQLSFSRKKFNSIMQDGLAALDRKQYSQAMDIYEGGYSLHRDEFDENDYGSVLKDLVLRSLDDLQKAVKSFQRSEKVYTALLDQGQKTLNQDPVSLIDTLKPLETQMNELVQLRRRIYRDSEVFKEQNKIIAQSGSEITQDFFLSFSYLVTRGRDNSPVLEGMTGTLDRLIKDNLDLWTNTLRTRLEDQWVQGENALNQRNWTTALRAFDQIQYLAQAGSRVTALWNYQAYPSAKGVLSPEYEKDLPLRVTQAAYWKDRYLIALQGSKASQVMQASEGVKPEDFTDPGLVNTARQGVREQKTSLASFASFVTGRQQIVTSLESAGWANLDKPTFFTPWANRWVNYQTQKLNLEIALVDRRGSLEFNTLSDRLGSIRQNMAQAQKFVDGTPLVVGNGTVNAKYPESAVQILTKEIDTQRTLQKDLTDYIGRYEGETSDVRTALILAWGARGRALLDQLNQLQNRRDSLLTLAKEAAAQAQALKTQGKELLAQVMGFVGAEDFTRARNLLTQGSNRYGQSLNLQEDADFRKSSDEEVKNLFARILESENRVVVRDVRRQISQGTQNYLQGQFIQAEQVLVRAQNRWSQTNTDPNSEVEYWLRLTRYALSVNTGREISPTDPLYNEIQPLLNFARRDYEDAQELQKKGESSQASKLLDQAKSTLGKVLIPFPLNQDARVLNLQILKTQDPEAFPQAFSNQYLTAVANLKDKPDQAYNDLLDLRSIQADYPGLAGSIKEARLLLKLDRPEANPADLRDSKNLTALAQKIYDSGNVGQFGNALNQVNQALEKDPTNTQAQDLKDKLSLALPATVATMTPTQLMEFNRIQGVFIEGRKLEAQSQLNQFLRNYPNLTSDPRVKELKRRLQAAL